MEFKSHFRTSQSILYRSIYGWNSAIEQPESNLMKNPYKIHTSISDFHLHKLVFGFGWNDSSSSIYMLIRFLFDFIYFLLLYVFIEYILVLCFVCSGIKVKHMAEAKERKERTQHNSKAVTENREPTTQCKKHSIQFFVFEIVVWYCFRTRRKLASDYIYLLFVFCLQILSTSGFFFSSRYFYLTFTFFLLCCLHRLLFTRAFHSFVRFVSICLVLRWVSLCVFFFTFRMYWSVCIEIS